MRLCAVLLAPIWLMLASCASVPASLQDGPPAPQVLRFGPAMGALYEPQGAPIAGVVLIHRTANFMTHIACTELSSRGFVVLCMNSRYVNNESQVEWDNVSVDLKAGVEFMRAREDVSRVYLFGHSGGGAVVAYYQAVAEQGVSYCQNPQRIWPCDERLANLPPADGVILADSQPGQAVTTLRGLNPAVLDEANPPRRALNSTLNPFEPANGFNPDGASHYDEAFRARYFAGQSQRMNRLIADAQARRAEILAGRASYPDNDIVIIPRGGNPGNGGAGTLNLAVLDPSIPGVAQTRAPRPVLHNDGTVSEQISHTLFQADPTLRETNLSFDTGTRILTLRSFLSANAVRSTNSFDGIEHCSANGSMICAMGVVRSPVLFGVSQAHYFLGDNERAYEDSPSADKTYLVLEGATHSLTPCTRCESTPGEFSNATKNFFDYTANWMTQRAHASAPRSEIGLGGGN